MFPVDITLLPPQVELAGAMGGHTAGQGTAANMVITQEAAYAGTGSSSYPVMRSLQALLDAEGLAVTGNDDPDTPRLGGQLT